MAEQCPTAGYTCVNQLMARVQAVTDQLVGFREFVEKSGLPISSSMILKHYEKAATLLQAALDAYAEDHGTPDAWTDVEAVRWVLTGLK